MLNEQLAKLPKWAQAHIETQRREIESLRVERDLMDRQVADPWVWVPSHLHERLPLLGSTDLRIGIGPEDANEQFHVRYDPMKPDLLQVSLPWNAHRMCVIPRVSNVVEIRSER